MQIKNKILNIKTSFILLPFIFGLFYEFAVSLAAILFIVIIIKMLIQNKRIKIYFNYCFLSILILTIFSLLTCIWAIDKQDAIFGFFRILTILLFVIILMQQEYEEIKACYKIIPRSAIIMIIICIIMKFIPNLSEYVYSDNGRLGGFFQYSNTFALFLLIGINILIYDAGKIKIKIFQVMILLIGILLTGSRTVFLLTILTFIIYLFLSKNKKEKIIMFSLFLIIILISLIIVAKTNNLQTIGRYLTISINSSTLWGRIIYYKDALKLIKNNIFGYGYMGYSYIYPTVQTANYSVLFVHNDFLQIALDYGIFAMLSFIGAILYSIFCKKTNKIQKIILILMFLHMMIDFDLQFLVMFFVLIFMQDLTRQKKWEITIDSSIVLYVVMIIILFGYAYLGIANFTNYIERNNIAINMLSNYTQAKVDFIKNEKDLNNANRISNEILKNNKYVLLAYEIKFSYELECGNYENACKYKEKLIELNKYNSKQYEDYIMLLSKILDNAVREKDDENTKKCMKKIISVLELIEKNKNETSSLAIKIQDNSDIVLNNQTIKYINEIKEIMKE